MRTISITHRLIAYLMVVTLVIVEVPLRDAAAAERPVDLVVVYKSRQMMQLVSGNKVVRSYKVAVGRNPRGHKLKAGDRRTPEGAYVIDRHKKDSRFYKSLHISYPNQEDLAKAKNSGHSPGGNIMIHGLPKGYEDLTDLLLKTNWTQGCIAVKNTDMDEIWKLVADGTPIIIKP